MRSITQSSAGIPIVSQISPSPPTISSFPYKPTCQITPSSHLDTSLQTQPHPSTSSTQQPSFFDVHSDTHLLSQQSRHHITQAIQHGWAESMVKRYSGAISQFIQFCEVEGVPDHLHFPADEFILSAFAASSVGVHSRSTPCNRLSALKAWHIAHNVEWKGSSRIRYVLNGVHNLAPRGSRRPPCPPVNVTMITQLVERLDLNDPLEVAIAACTTTAFWGQCRLGELLPTSTSALLSTPFPLRSGFKRSLRNPLSCVIHLPHTKTHRHGQEVVLVDQQAVINPISLLKKHLRVNNIPNDAHLFSYTTAHGFSSLTKSIFLRRCNTIWCSLGYPRTTGHCLRIGGTTELLIAGTPQRWSSDSFLRYWRSLDDIALQYIHHLHTQKHRRRRPPFGASRWRATDWAVAVWG
jgi:hypothetical protein